MTTLIALRKQQRAETLGLATSSTSDKRSMMAQSARGSERSEVLRSEGFQQLTKGFMREEDDVLEPTEADEFRRLGYIGGFVVDAQSEDKTESAKAILEPDYHLMPNIELSIPVPQASGTARLNTTGASMWPDESGVQSAWENGNTGSGTIIGVLDTGVDADHRELRRKRIDFRFVPLRSDPQNIRDCRGFDTNGHGTHVCGIIAGRNVGVAPGADLLVASVIESETTRTSLERIVIGLDWMLSRFATEEHSNKPAIVSMSLGFLPGWISAPDTQAVMEGIRLILSTLVDDFDVLPVIAIGNEGAGVMRAPGYFHEALSVGAVDFSRSPAPFSGGGQSPLGTTEPDIAGFGVDVLSSLERSRFNRSRYVKMSGTSMATPYVAGIAALTAASNPGLIGNSLRQAMVTNALQLNFPADRVGAGLARFV